MKYFILVSSLLSAGICFFAASAYVSASEDAHESATGRALREYFKRSEVALPKIKTAIKAEEEKRRDLRLHLGALEWNSGDGYQNYNLGVDYGGYPFIERYKYNLQAFYELKYKRWKSAAASSEKSLTHHRAGVSVHTGKMFKQVEYFSLLEVEQMNRSDNAKINQRLLISFIGFEYHYLPGKLAFGYVPIYEFLNVNRNLQEKKSYEYWRSRFFGEWTYRFKNGHKLQERLEISLLKNLKNGDFATDNHELSNCLIYAWPFMQERSPWEFYYQNMVVYDRKRNYYFRQRSLSLAHSLNLAYQF
ncbi:MAG: hypothetical protein HQK52_17580 [Oligoflexia bacterium]|nr:hypothetical protein [Oligoflexia bacterium]